MTGIEALLISAGIQAASAIAGGISSAKAGNKEAAMAGQQASLVQQEAQRNAQQKAREVRNFRSNQGLAYLSSGVTLEGTPIQKMEETRQLGQQEVNAIMSRGRAQADLLMQQGRMAKTAGRNAMIGSLFKAAGTAASTGMRLNWPTSSTSPLTGGISDPGGWGVPSSYSYGTIPSWGQ